MANATATDIANAIVNAISAVPGVPDLVVWRKVEAFHPNIGSKGDPPTGIVVSGGPESTTWRTFGQFNGAKGVGTDFPFIVAYFAPTTPDVTASNSTPLLFENIKDALSVTTLPGAPTVWDYDIADRAEWENQPFRDGTQVSRFGVLYRSTNSVG